MNDHVSIHRYNELVVRITAMTIVRTTICAKITVAPESGSCSMPYILVIVKKCKCEIFQG